MTDRHRHVSRRGFLAGLGAAGTVAAPVFDGAKALDEQLYRASSPNVLDVVPAELPLGAPGR